jgi:membrane fusion protein, protease secretion system
MSKMKLLKQNEISDVVSHEVSPLEVQTDATQFTRIGWLIVLFGVVGFLVWASFAPLDKGVPVSGTVSVAGNRKAVQFLSGGIVSKILVKEGDTVKKGQVLVRMDDLQARANVDMTRVQYIAMRATEARLLAERDGKTSLEFPPALVRQASDPRAEAALQVQRQLFATRQSALRDELSALDQSIGGLQAQIDGLRETAENKKFQRETLKEQVDNVRGLAKDGFVARNRLMELERTLSQLEASQTEDRSNSLRLQRQAAELKLRGSQRRAEFQRDVRAVLGDAARDAELLERRLQSQQKELDNTEVRAPADGVVADMNVFTEGGVVGAGARMMEIVPSLDALEVTGQIPINLVDKVHKGLPVDLIFSAFNQSTTPKISGVVTQVSADRLTEERTGAPYYRMRVSVTPKGLHDIERLKLQLRPGMPAELFVHTGERTMMNYLFKPLVDRAKTSLSEE